MTPFLHFFFRDVTFLCSLFVVLWFGSMCFKLPFQTTPTRLSFSDILPKTHLTQYYLLFHLFCRKRTNTAQFTIMLRRSAALLIGNESSNVFISVVKDKRYLEHRLATLGKVSANNDGHKPMTDDDLKRFTTSIGNKENLFNFRAGSEPTGVVDEETGRIIGSEAPDPTRYGDWEYNGRATDF